MAWKSVKEEELEEIRNLILAGDEQKAAERLDTIIKEYP